MKSIFLRIYGGMLLALLLVSGLGLLGLHWINEVRGEHYREELARGTFRLMADNLQPMTATERKRGPVSARERVAPPKAEPENDGQREHEGPLEPAEQAGRLPQHLADEEHG